MSGAVPPAAAPDGAPFGPEEFRRATDVSRETLARLEIYAALLRKWQKAVNLVSNSTLDDLWRRHFLDSQQILPLIPPQTRIAADLGSGAGFPGMVLAILGRAPMHLVESDARKCVFLAEVARATGAQVEIHRTRIEALPPLGADLVTARALAPLDRLLAWGARHGTESTTYLFLKGQDVERELTLASKSWSMTIDRHPSRTSPDGLVLEVRGLRRV